MNPAGGKTTLFVGDLATFCREDDIMTTFSPFGEVLEVKIMKSEESHRNLSYGFVKFASAVAAEEAMQRLNGKILCGRPMRIRWAAYKNKLNSKESRVDGIDNSPVHVSFISYQVDRLVTEESLRLLFSRYGYVVDVSIKKSMIDPEVRRQSGYGFVYYSTLPEGVEAAIAASRELADQTIDNVNYKSSLSHNLMKNLQPEVNSDMENMSNGANRSAPPRSTAHSHGSAHESSSPTGGVGDTASASKHGHTQLSAHASVQTVQHPPSHAAVSHHQQLQQVAPPPPPPVMHDGYAVHYGPPSHPEAGMYMVNPSSMAVYPAPQVMHGSPVLPYNSFVQPLPPPASGMYPALVPGAPMMAPESMFAPNSPANSYRAFPSPGQSMRGPMLPMGPAGGMGMMPGVYLSVPPQPMHQSPALSSQSADSVREEQLSYLHYLVSPATPYYAGMSPTALAASSPLMGHGYAPGYHQDAYYGRSPRHAQPSGVWATGVEPAGGNHVADAPRSIRPARSVSSRARQTLISEATGSSNAQR